jgi:hypothetical protein
MKLNGIWQNFVKSIGNGKQQDSAQQLMHVMTQIKSFVRNLKH